MLEYTQNQSARVPIRLFNTNTGTAVSGIPPGSVVVSVEQPNGSAATVVIDGSTNIWTEVTTGAFAGQGKYDLVLAGTNLSVLGPLTIAVTGGASNITGMALIQVVALPDTVSPVVGNFSPPPGTIITGRTPISFDVTDANSPLRRIIVAISYANTMVELAYDGSSFRGDYAAFSTKTIITNGFTFLLQRRSNWPASPTVEVYPVDTSGNE